MLVQYSQDQLSILDHIQGNPRTLISGCSGSGKTLLALEAALRLEGEGQRALLLCVNPFLAESLRRRVQGSAVQIADFNSFLRAVLQQPEESTSPKMPVVMIRPKFDHPWTQFDQPSAAELNLAIDRLLNLPERFDAVVVDQGQDFQESWWGFVETCLDDPEGGRLILFFDDNQAVYPLHAQLWLENRLNLTPAPLVLTQNCRNSDQIFELIRQLHAENPITQRLLAGSSSVKEWIFTSEPELFQQAREAIIAAEPFLQDLRELVVISAENNPRRHSKLNGLVLDSPRLQASSVLGRLNWQTAIFHYLHRFGLVGHELSDQASPSSEDIRKISRFSSNYLNQHHHKLNRQVGYSAKFGLRWQMDLFGELLLQWKEHPDLEIPDLDLLIFFSSPGWSKTLPPAHRRYRLTCQEEIGSFPQYENIQLVDIPSFKGLEAECAVFVMYNYFAEDQLKLLANLYEGFSRARRVLHIVSPFSLL